MNNQEYKVTPQILMLMVVNLYFFTVVLKKVNCNVNGCEPIFFHCSIKKSKGSGSSNNIYDLYANLCVPDVVKNLNVRAFNLMSRANETRHIEWHESCKSKLRLDASICNNKQRWNEDKCRCECKELIDKGTCNKGFIWNPSNYEFECDTSCSLHA